MNEQKFYQNNEITAFNNDVAVCYGVDAAIFLQNFRFWILTNKRNSTNFHDGRTWTYNSIKAFCNQFPYYTAKQIRTILKKLTTPDKNNTPAVLLTGNYNKTKYDRTIWYAFSDEAAWGISLKKEEVHSEHDSVNRMCPNRQMDVPNKTNGSEHKGNPIPDTSPDNKKDTYLPQNPKPEKKEVGKYSSEKGHNPSSLEVCSLNDEVKLISILERNTGKKLAAIEYVQEWYAWCKVKQEDLHEVKAGAAWVKSYHTFVEQHRIFVQAQNEKTLCKKREEAAAHHKKNYNPYNDMRR